MSMYIFGGQRLWSRCTFYCQQLLKIVKMLSVRDAAMNPAAVSTGIFIGNIGLGILPHLAVNGFKLLAAQSHHHCKSIVFSKYITNKLFLFSVRNTPSIVISVREYDFCTVL